MQNQHSVFIALLFSLVLVSCDIPGLIVVTNKSGDVANFLIQKSNPEESLIAKGLPDQNVAYFHFGFGQFWKDERLAEFVGTTEKLEIQTQVDTLIISDKEELLLYLKKRRKGLFKSALEINIK